MHTKKGKNYKISRDLDKILHSFMKLVVKEVKREKDIDISEHINNVVVMYNEQLEPEDSVRKCEFIYQSPRKIKTTGHQYERGDNCIDQALPGERYCRSHKWNKQYLKLAEKEKREKIRLENKLNGKEEDIEDPYLLLQEYYPNPGKDLTYLYDQVFADKANNIVMPNPDRDSIFKWAIVCKSRVNPVGKRIFTIFPLTAINDLESQRAKYNYDYIVDPELFIEVVPDRLTLTAARNRNYSFDEDLF